MSGRKIKKIAELAGIARALKEKGKIIVFTNGCFDLLHYGHLAYLEKAKAKGDILIVALNSDASVKRLKGRGRPLVTQKDRARIIAGLECVDYVTVFNEDTPLKTLKKIKPDILVKGADWHKKTIVGADLVKKMGGKICTIALEKGRATSALIKKILERY